MKTIVASILVILVLEYSTAAAENPGAPAVDETRQIRRSDLPALMEKHKPPYAGLGQSVDAAISFDRVDVIIDMGMPGPHQTPYLSIGRNGSYLYKIHTLQVPNGKAHVGANLVGRLSATQTAELQQLLKATDWLTAEGGEGPALHTDANNMLVALSQDGKTKTVLLQGHRPAPYADLQKFFDALVWRENIYYRLTRLRDERAMALYEFHDAIECALGRPGHGKPSRQIDFDRYHELFAQTLRHWESSTTSELSTAIDLMVLLERKEHAEDIARLRNDRDSNLRIAVARALPALSGEKAIPWLVEMVKSTEESRIALIRLGEAAVPTIVEIIEKDESMDRPPSVSMIRAYIDHWSELSKPINANVIAAVIANMALEIRRRDLKYQREFLKLAGEQEPKPATLRETAELFFKHLKAGNKEGLIRIKDNVGSVEEWLKLSESFDPGAELKIETLLVTKDHAFLQTQPLKDKSGSEIHAVIFFNLLRGSDWRVGPTLSESAQRNRYQDRFRQSNPDAKEPLP